MEEYELTDREKSILRHVIHQFILTASPVGSRYISKKYNLGLSPATVRNIMSDLEDIGLLGHPHTSAGRTPTDKGYRFYVDSLMDPPRLEGQEIQLIDEVLDADLSETDELLRITSIILSDITKQLACVTLPKFENAVLQKIQIVQLSSSRILVVLSVKSGLVKTITLELNSEIRAEKLKIVQRLLNERLAGLKLSEIRKTIKERMKDYLEDYKPIVRLFLDSADKIFTDLQITDRAVIMGAKNILRQPEFEDHENFQSIIELVEDRDVVIHFMNKGKSKREDDVTITIGEESQNEKFSEYSMISKEYKIGEVSGMLGIVGPKRMQYSKVVAAIVYIAEMLSQELKNHKI